MFKKRLQNRLSLDNLDAWMLMNLYKDILEQLTNENIIDEIVIIVYYSKEF